MRLRERQAVALALLLVIAILALGLAVQVTASPPVPPALAAARPRDLYEVRVNAGGTGYTDTLGNYWQPDQAYTAGSWGYVGGSSYLGRTDWDILGTLDDPLYRTARVWNNNPGQYVFDVPTGTYEIDLRFAELHAPSAIYGYRLFDVLIEGRPYLCMMDILSAANKYPNGKYTAYDWTFVVTVTESPLTIAFLPRQATINQAIVSAIRVTQIEDYSRPPLAPYDRIGVGINNTFGEITDYDVAAMHLGWYANWAIRYAPQRPNGIDYVQMIITRDFNPTTYNWVALSYTVGANPGAAWIIGNEIEANFQGNHTPQQYASIYHTFYTFIKQLDPTARIAVGGVVMVSDARLRWLDDVLAAYSQTHGISMPVDIWTIHEQILGGAEHPNNWPVGIPGPGQGGPTGEYHSWYCGDTGGPNDVNQFKNDVIKFRQWMKARGYQDRPLWISEYGVLGGDQYNCTQWVIGDYLRATMDWLWTAADAVNGMPADDNRLVQRWLWYSMNDKPYSPNETPMGFAGALCYHGCPSYPGALTGVGRALVQWVNSITPPGPTPTPTQTRTPTVTPTPTATRTPLPPGNGVLSGTVQLQGRGAPPTPAWSVPLNIRFFLPGDDMPAYQFMATTDESGGFVVPGTATPGIWAATYNVKLKNPQMLQAVANNVAFGNDEPTVRDFGLLKGGDANDDNVVNIQDFSLLSSSYFKSLGQPGFNPAADFTGDGTVNIQDFSLLSTNYFQVGMAAAGILTNEAKPSDWSSPGLQGSAVIRFQPSPFNLIVNRDGNLDVWVTHSGSPLATGADVFFSFPPSVLSVNSITASPGFTLLAPSWDNAAGTGQFGAGKLGGTFTGATKIATISFRAKAVGSGIVAFQPGTKVGEEGGGTSSPLTMQPSTVTVTNPPTATPTPTLCVGCPTHTPTPTPPPLNIGVNAGGPQYTDRQGHVWFADQAYVAGSWGYVGGGGQTYSTSNAIANTDDDPLYQTERYGMSQYAFDVSPGVYSVTLKFAEIYYGGNVGDRVFSVKAEGQPVVTDLDLLRQAGRYVAYDRSFLVTVNDYQLNLEFTASKGAAKVNAIRVQHIGGDAPTATPTATQTSIGASTPTVTATATSTATPTASPTPRDPYEPNDSFAQAYPIQPNQDYLGYIEGESDVDYFAFTVADPLAFIWVSLTDLPADYDLFLHRSDGSPVAWSTYGGTTSEYILNYAVGGATGTYYVRVLGYARAFNRTAPYRLRVELRSATPTATPTRTPTATATATGTPTPTATRQPLDLYEPNNTFEQATAITLNSAVFGFLDTIADTDYYKFTVVAAGRLITVALTQLPADYDIYLFGPSRSLVAYSGYGGTASEYIFYAAATAGEYYVQVVGYNHAYEPVRPYRLLVQVQ